MDHGGLALAVKEENLKKLASSRKFYEKEALLVLFLPQAYTNPPYKKQKLHKIYRKQLQKTRFLPKLPCKSVSCYSSPPFCFIPQHGSPPGSCSFSLTILIAPASPPPLRSPSISRSKPILCDYMSPSHIRLLDNCYPTTWRPYIRWTWSLGILVSLIHF